MRPGCCRPATAALLVEVDDLDTVLALADRLRAGGRSRVCRTWCRRPGRCWSGPSRGPDLHRLGSEILDLAGDLSVDAATDAPAAIRRRPGPLRRAGPGRGGRGHRVDPRRGGGRAHRSAVARRVRRVRAGILLSDRRRRPARRAAAARIANQRPGRIRRAGRRLLGGVSAGIARRLAVDRHHGRRAVGRRSATAGTRFPPAHGFDLSMSRPPRPTPAQISTTTQLRSTSLSAPGATRERVAAWWSSPDR